jgi:hypothetical protein
MMNSMLISSILEQAVAKVIKATAIEKTALSEILNLKNDIFQKAKTDSVNLEEFVCINESVNSLIRNIIQVQRVTQIKLQLMEKLLQKIEDLDENSTLEE